MGFKSLDVVPRLAAGLGYDAYNNPHHEDKNVHNCKASFMEGEDETE
jgi:hypothetical protein